MVPGRAGGTNAVPRVVGRVQRVRPVEVEDLKFLRARTDRTIKITLPGPFTMSQPSSNEFYADEAELAMDFAAAVNDEPRDLFAAGADIVQIDEPWLQSRAEKARDFALPAIDRALAGVARHDRPAHLLRLRRRRATTGPPGYPFLDRAGRAARADLLAIEAAQPKLDPACWKRSPARPRPRRARPLDDAPLETPEVVAERIAAALTRDPAERLQVGPDCGMKYLSRDVAFAKLQALVAGAALALERL